jgi:type I restriction enzyme S subunit
LNLLASEELTPVIRKWKPYPTYKDSGVEWLGEIPGHWVVKRLKYLVLASTEKLVQKPDDLPYIGLEHVETETGRLLLDSPVDTVDSAVSRFEPGDVLFGKLRPYLAKVLIADFEGTCTSELLVLRPTNEMVGRYLFYQLLSRDFIRLVTSLTYGTKMPRSSPEQILNLCMTCPPKSEQEYIVACLDRETAKTDALVAKKERLIELLQEKRAALITRAVTKGLPSTGSGQVTPNVPMKDSGVEWLGEIPAHWEVRRIKFFTTYVTSGSRGWAEYYSDDGAIFLRIGNLTRTGIDLDLTDIQRVTPPSGAEGERTRVRKNDVLISITAYIGSVAVVDDKLDAYVNQHIALTRPVLDRVSPRWIAYCFLSAIGKSQFQQLLYGGTKDGLSLDDVRNLVASLPPVKEQTAIVEFLDKESAKTDSLIAKVREGIEKLKEYRTALISAAVTGKINVRQDVVA